MLWNILNRLNIFMFLITYQQKEKVYKGFALITELISLVHDIV